MPFSKEVFLGKKGKVLTERKVKYWGNFIYIYKCMLTILPLDVIRTRLPVGAIKY